MKRLFISRLLLYLYITTYGASSRRTRDAVCATVDCFKSTREMYNWLDTSVEPCDDFFQFACGGWLNSHPIPETELSTSSMRSLSNVIVLSIVDILTNSSYKGHSYTIQKAKKLFNSCMKDGTINARGLKPLISLLNKCGQWPAALKMSTWKSTDASLEKILLFHLREAYSVSLYGISVENDLKDSSINRLYIQPPSMPLRHMFHDVRKFNEEYKNLYVNAIRKTIKLVANEIGDIPHFHNIQKDVRALVEFQHELANLLPEISALNDLNQYYYPMTLKEFQIFFDSHLPREHVKINWLRFMQNLYIDSDVTISNDLVIIVFSKNYIRDLIHLLNRTPIRTIVNYIQWDFINGLMAYLSDDMRLIKTNLQQIFNPRAPFLSRKATCIIHLGFEHALNYEFYRHALISPLQFTIAGDVAASVKNVSALLLSSVPWLLPEDKVRVFEKVRDMSYTFAYPSWYTNVTAIDDLYRELKVGESYFENQIDASKYLMKKHFEKIHKPVDKASKFADNPTEINALHFRNRNSINFLTGFLLPPILNVHHTKAMQYGSFGSRFGHELVHGFDSAGVHYDKYGNYKQWLSNESLSVFKSQVKCLIEQYDKFIEYQDHSTGNGTRKQTENIADLVGLHLAYAAYKSTRTMENEISWFSDLENYTDRQLFFIAYGHILCGANRREFYEHPVFGNGLHGTFKFRVNGIVSNMDEFSAAFNCKKGSPMNPSNKCHIWLP